MGVVYQLTFFLALGLLAIVITIFVFAVSLLGRAIETASREQEKTTKEQKDATEREIAGIQKQISDLLGKKGRIDKEKLKELETKLKQLGKDDERFEKKLGRIRKASELLTVKGGLAPCGGWLLGALILNGVAWYFWYLSTFDIFLDIYLPFGFFIRIEPVFIWILGLAAIGYTISRIYQCLRVIERVAITSEEAAMKKQIEAFKIAQKELAAEKKPILQLQFEDPQPPFHIKVDSKTELEFNVRLKSGEVADNAFVVFNVPPGFSFPGKKPTIQSKTHPVCPNFVATRIDYTLPITQGIAAVNEVVIKAPSKAGQFPGYYRIFCRGFASEFEKFEIVVE